MRRAWHTFLFAIMIVSLLAPSVLPCAAACKADEHACCPASPALNSDCCCASLHAPRAIVPHNERAAATVANILATVPVSLQPMQADLAPRAVCAHLPIHNSPPIVLRT
jgi:hypothetical protein